MARLRDRGRRRILLLLLLAGVGGLSGCVERRYTIRSNPPRSQVIVNGEEIGPTPVSRSFVYYGDREVTLMHDGYQTNTIIQPVKAPWWDNYLTEFFTENFIPYTFRDEREFTYELMPESVPPTDQLLDRGQNLRNQAQSIPPPRRKGILAYFGL